MKNLGVFLNIYVLLCLAIIHTDWFIANRDYMDLMDTPFYVLALFYFRFNYKKLNGFQFYSYIFCFLGVVFKWIDYQYLNSDYEVYVFWHMIINGIFPALALLYKVKGVEDENNLLQ